MTFAATHNTQIDDRQKIWDLIKDIKFTMMVTEGPQGRMSARPMANQKVGKDGYLWFFTAANSPKAEEIRQNPKVLLTYAEPADNSYVSVTGEATVIRDQVKVNELWSEELKAWFPDGKDDPNLALIRVDPQAGEYWDGPSSAVVQVFGYIKAKITGKPEAMGENKVLTL